MNVSIETAKRLAIYKQHLAGAIPTNPTSDSIMEVMEDIRYLQLDPIRVVAPSHLLVLWSRLGNFATAELDKLLWKEKRLFEYWAHMASIVMMKDYPLFSRRMKEYADSSTGTSGRANKWDRDNAEVGRYVLGELRKGGGRLSREFEDKSRKRTVRAVWANPDVPRTLAHLFFKGTVMVAGRKGSQKVWDLAENFLPSSPDRKEISLDELETRAAERSLLALGIATPKQVGFHFLSRQGPHPILGNLRKTMNRLQAEGKVLPVALTNGHGGPESWYVHKNDLRLIDRIASDFRRPRTTLLSPFDNLIIDRARTESLFNFRFRIEIYNPKSIRRYGYYVLPILHGENLIGRVDPAIDRRNGRLVINAVHAERGAPSGSSVSGAIAAEIRRLAEFIGARDVVYSGPVPDVWARSLR